MLMLVCYTTRTRQHKATKSDYANFILIL